MSNINSVSQHNRPPTHGIWTLVVVQVVWMALLLGLLAVLELFSFERYYMLSYLGLVVGIQLFAPTDSTQRWWRSVTWISRLGFVGLCYFVAVHVEDIVQL